MTKTALLGATALRSVLFIGVAAAAGVATAAAAQTATTTTSTTTTVATAPDGTTAAQTTADVPVAGTAKSDTAANPSGTSEITVTGTRIRSLNLSSASPVTTVTGDQIFQTGKVSVGDLLNDLPQLRSTYSTQNSTRFLGTRGLNLIDARGLGTQRTLVLVNGRRHVGSDVLTNGVSVDINTIPSALVEKIDLTTGGASAVYGSDAVAGVVNFILKKDFDGINVRGQGGISKYSDAQNAFASVLLGKNFADGRGNIVVAGELSHQQDFYASKRPELRTVNAFLITETDPAGSVNGAANGFDRTFFSDVRSTTISLGGLVAIRNSATTAPCGIDNFGNAFTCVSLFNQDGTTTPVTGTRVGIGPNGSFIGGNSYVGREGKLLALSPKIDRYSLNILGHYEISPALVPFFEAKYVRSLANGSQSGPFFSQGQTLGDSISVLGVNDRSYASPTSAAVSNVNREGIRLDNPYLSAQARAAISAQALAAINANVNPNTGGAFTTTAASLANKALLLAQVANGTFRFNLRRNYLDLGIRDEKFKRETYRFVGGLRGQFNGDWNYELSANYGEHKEVNRIQGNVNRQRFLLANDTAVNGAGQIVCRSQIDARYAPASSDRGGNPAVLAADVAACVPLNPFGTGNISQAAKDYLTVQSTATGKITQFDALGFVSGDLSQLFELPGGPIGFSLGGEYRRETLNYTLDPVTQAGYAFYNAIPSFKSPSFGVKEAFAEINLPIFKDSVIGKELSVRGSGRISKYKGSPGTIKTYGVEGVYIPIRDITLRAAYNRAVRAPNLSELYSAQGQNFAPGFADPCSARALANGSSNRVANCSAAGRPAAYDYVYSSSLEILSGGNPNLRPEVSDSITAGIILQPRFLPGLSVSADYYDITVNKVIASIGSAQTIANQCYDSPNLTNPFCPLFTRAGASGGPRGEEPFRILEGSLLQASANFAQLKARGVDTQINYRRNTGFGKLSLHALWTHVLKNESYTDPLRPTFVDVTKGELGDPDDQVNFDASITHGRFTLGYGLRWIDKMYLNTYEDYNSVNGLPPQNNDYAPIRRYPAIFYHNVRIDYDLNKHANVYFGVDNLTNRYPPYGLTGVGGGSGIYDNRGRYFYAGFIGKF